MSPGEVVSETLEDCEDKPIKDMTMAELLANQIDQEPVEQAQSDDED